MDFVGPFPETSRGNKYLIVAMDYFTKWVEVVPTKDATAQTVAEVVMRDLISRFGTPETIHTDQGKAFKATLVKELFQRLGINKTRTTPYHPQSDGMVERFNRTLEALLTATIHENQDDWDIQAPIVASAYRATVHSSTGFTPNFLMWGREAVLPIDIAYGPPREGEGEQVQLQEGLRREREAHRVTTEALERSREMQKKYYDQGKTPYEYSQGERVWCFIPMKEKGRCPKIQSFWTGPWTLEKKLSTVVWTIKKENKLRTVHVDLLKPYEAGEEVIATFQTRMDENDGDKPHTPPSVKRWRRGVAKGSTASPNQQAAAKEWARTKIDKEGLSTKDLDQARVRDGTEEGRETKQMIKEEKQYEKRVDERRNGRSSSRDEGETIEAPPV